MACFFSAWLVVLVFTATAEPPWPVLTNEWALLTGDHSDTLPAIGNDGMIYTGTFLGDLLAVSPEGRLNWIFHAGRDRAVQVERLPGSRRTATSPPGPL